MYDRNAHYMGWVLDTALVLEWPLKDHQFYLKLNPSNVSLHFGIHLSILSIFLFCVTVCLHVFVCVCVYETPISFFLKQGLSLETRVC